jgi:hypothetical protein
MTKFDDKHASQYGLHIDREAFSFPVEPPERAKARGTWLRLQLAAARARGLRIVRGVIE